MATNISSFATLRLLIREEDQGLYYVRLSTNTVFVKRMATMEIAQAHAGTEVVYTNIDTVMSKIKQIRRPRREQITIVTIVILSYESLEIIL